MNNRLGTYVDCAYVMYVPKSKFCPLFNYIGIFKEAAVGSLGILIFEKKYISPFKQTYFYVIAIGVFVCLPTSNITFDAGAVDIL